MAMAVFSCSWEKAVLSGRILLAQKYGQVVQIPKTLRFINDFVQI